LAGRGGLIEIAVDEARTKRRQHRAGLRRMRAEAHDRDRQFGMIHQERGELLQISPGGDSRGNLEDGRGAVIELPHPVRELRRRGGLFDGVGREYNGLARAARFIDHRLHGARGGQFHVNRLDVRQ